MSGPSNLTVSSRQLSIPMESRRGAQSGLAPPGGTGVEAWLVRCLARLFEANPSHDRIELLLQLRDAFLKVCNSVLICPYSSKSHQFV